VIKGPMDNYLNRTSLLLDLLGANTASLESSITD
jgi:hypothetical protein